MNFIEELSKLKKPVWRALEGYLPVKEPLGHYEMVKDYPLRQGKYLRPGLLLLSIRMFGGRGREGLLAAAAMQASEEWLLIHDDVEDRSEIRRHKPTLNALYGSDLAINAGDALHILMWKILADAVRSFQGKQDKKGWKIFDKMNEILLKATEGQYLELEWIRRKKIFVPEADYLDMVKRKTAYYTIIGPIELGAIIAGASSKEIKKIEKWGTLFGYAFQIWDDYMNISTASGKQGKEFAGDIMEGKRTLILSHLFSHASPAEKRTIEKIYKKDRSEKTEAEKRYILELIRAYGSDTYAKELARSYGEKAMTLFLESTSHLKNTKARRIMAAGIEFVSRREH